MVRLLYVRNVPIWRLLTGDHFKRCVNVVVKKKWRTAKKALSLLTPLTSDRPNYGGFERVLLCPANRTLISHFPYAMLRNELYVQAADVYLLVPRNSRSHCQLELVHNLHRIS